jgi:hypothetical protein
MRQIPAIHVVDIETPREAAGLKTSALAGAGTSPSGHRTARRNFSVETLIRFIAYSPHGPGQQRQLLAREIAHISHSGRMPHGD